MRGRFGNRWLALAVALTGILATMPYIALQLVGIQVVIGAMGVETQRARRRPAADHRLRHPGRVHLHVRPARAGDDRGRQGHADLHHDHRGDHRRAARISAATARCSRAVPAAKLLLATPPAGSLGSFSAYATLALGSALRAVPVSALDHRHPECVQRARDPAQRGDAAGLFAAARPARAARLHGACRRRADDAGVRRRLQALQQQLRGAGAVPGDVPGWFVGVAFAAIAIGALVPAAIMSIATANTFTRNIYREFINPACTRRRRKADRQVVSLVIKAGALVFIFFLPLQYALRLQLLGGVWIIQTLPAVILGLYTRLFHGWALLIGWVCGFGLGTWMVARQTTLRSIR